MGILCGTVGIEGGFWPLGSRVELEEKYLAKRSALPLAVETMEPLLETRGGKLLTAKLRPTTFAKDQKERLPLRQEITLFFVVVLK